jgi:hypothetical protein
MKLDATGILVLSIVTFILIGCVPVQEANRAAPFVEEDFENVLTILIDTSGSFRDKWREHGYQLFLELSDQFFAGAIGTRTRLVLGQIGSGKHTVFFEGQVSDLRMRFASPDQLSSFLNEHSTGASNVYQATGDITRYVNNLAGVGPGTRLLTVVFSDMRESTVDDSLRSTSGREMLEELKAFRAKNGAIALYYVAEDEIPRWRRILEEEAEFPSGYYVIENHLSESPQLPNFE